MMNHKEAEGYILGLSQILVPRYGKSNAVAGEIARAISHIWYRFQNDGDQIGRGPGKDEVEGAARYLSSNAGPEVRNAIHTMRRTRLAEDYEEALNAATIAVASFLQRHPELQTEHNETDMLRYPNS